MFIVPLVNVRTLTVDEYGYYKQFWLIYETVTPIVILGFSRSLLYFLPRIEEPEKRSAYITQTVMFLAMSSVVAILIYAVMARTLGEGLGEAARSFFWRLCFFTFFTVTTDYMETLFVAQKKPVTQSVYHAAVWGLQAVVVIAASYFSRDVSTIIWALTFFAMIRFFFAIAYTHVNFRLSLGFVSKASIAEQASFAIPVGLTGIVLLLLTQTDKFIINSFLGRQAFAVYSVGAFQVPLAGVIQTSVGNVTLPLLAQYQSVGDFAAMKDLWRRSLMKTTLFFFPAFVFLEVTARPFITILFTEEYADAAPVFMVYLLLFLRTSMETSTVIQACNRTKFLVAGLAIGFPVNVLLGITLFKLFGRIGVPFATLFTLTGITVANLFYISRLLDTTVGRLFPTRALLKRFLAAAIPGAVLWVAYRFYPVTNFFELAAAGLVYTGLYVFVGTRMGLMSTRDLTALVRRRRSG
ncbi:MAG: oligosaccharide flippase family protein [Candidatus Latescibacteria bacterium]|nr:oligosaccharide flippase family protein [Candidatus Latescibacterota bacterium]